MENEEIINVFESLGFNEKEIIIYLDLIKWGKSSVMHISKRTKIHRSNVYDILGRLTKKGVVVEVLEENKKLFSPISPKDFLNYFKQKELELKEIIPKIENIYNKIQSENKVMVSEGINAIRTAINSLLEINQPISTYGIPKNVVEILGGFIHQFHKERMAKRIPIRHLYNFDAQERLAELNKMPFTEAKHLSSLYDALIDTTICGNTLFIWMWEEPFTVIRIENESIAKTYQNYFEILWKNAK